MRTGHAAAECEKPGFRRRIHSSGNTPLSTPTRSEERRERCDRLSADSSIRHWHRQDGCRGFKGPVPPPLWMSASCIHIMAAAPRPCQAIWIRSQDHSVVVSRRHELCLPSGFAGGRWPFRAGFGVIGHGCALALRSWRGQEWWIMRRAAAGSGRGLPGRGRHGAGRCLNRLVQRTMATFVRQERFWWHGPCSGPRRR